MLQSLGKTQQQLLKKLHRNKSGFSMEELAEALEMTRTAVRQHLWALERNGFVCKGESQTPPDQAEPVYLLTHKGHDLFPKQYSWFSELLLASISEERGSRGLMALMEKLGEQVSTRFGEEIHQLEPAERFRKITAVMADLGYEAELVPGRSPEELPVIEASNCVYHQLAQAHPEVCKFDVTFLCRLSGKRVEHQECLARGGNVCRFKFGE